jgi:hypothetical protein
MSWTVNVAIMSRVRLVLHMRGVDGDTTSLFFRGLVNLGVVRELSGALVGQNFGNGGGQSRLAMIDVTCVTR